MKKNLFLLAGSLLVTVQANAFVYIGLPPPVPLYPAYSPFVYGPAVDPFYFPDSNPYFYSYSSPYYVSPYPALFTGLAIGALWGASVGWGYHGGWFGNSWNGSNWNNWHGNNWNGNNWHGNNWNNNWHGNNFNGTNNWHGANNAHGVTTFSHASNGATFHTTTTHTSQFHSQASHQQYHQQYHDNRSFGNHYPNRQFQSFHRGGGGGFRGRR
jgi:hypothetical protein